MKMDPVAAASLRLQKQQADLAMQTRQAVAQRSAEVATLAAEVHEAATAVARCRSTVALHAAKHMKLLARRETLKARLLVSSANQAQKLLQDGGANVTSAAAGGDPASTTVSLLEESLQFPLQPLLPTDLLSSDDGGVGPVGDTDASGSLSSGGNTSSGEGASDGYSSGAAAGPRAAGAGRGRGRRGASTGRPYRGASFGARARPPGLRQRGRGRGRGRRASDYF